MTGVVKPGYSPKKGKENRNLSNHIPVPSTLKKNAPNEVKSAPCTPKGDKSSRIPTEKGSAEKKNDGQDTEKESEESCSSSTSNRSVRPQTKILRRPTPNLQHPVIQVDSDDSGGDSSSSDKSKEDGNPKRLKMGTEGNSEGRRKNFVMYNKYNVDKNTKKPPDPKERSSATLVPSIPNPCNSCSRSQAPERLHSHAKRDARGLMNRRSPALVEPGKTDVKAAADTKMSVSTSIPKVPATETVDIKMASPTLKSKSQALRMDTKASPASSDCVLLPEASDVKMTSPTFKSKVQSTIRIESKTLPLAVSPKVAGSDVKMASPSFKSTSPSTNSSAKVPPLPDVSDIKMASPTPKPKITSISIGKHAASPASSTSISPPDSLGIKMSSPILGSKVPSLTVPGVTMPSTAFDVKMASPRKKPTKKNKGRTKGLRRSSSVDRIKDVSDGVQYSEVIATSIDVEEEQKDSLSEIVSLEPQEPSEDPLEPVKSCYICQSEFKLSTLLLHESKCLENWKKTNNALPPHLRQLPPRRPPEEPVTDPCWLQAVQSRLEPCPLCGRTFFPERLPVHRRVCKGRPSPRPLKRASSMREQSASSTDGEDCKPAPLYQPCYVCQRSFGSWVLAMHEQQCLRKWRRENDRLSEEDRLEEPSKDPEFHIDDDVASLVELGDHAWESHLQQLVPCPRCARTFFPDRLGVHERSCKGDRRPRSNRAT